MIPLRLEVEAIVSDEPLVVRLRSASSKDEYSRFGYDAIFKSKSNGWLEYVTAGVHFRVKAEDATSMNNDVLMVLPGATSAHRLIRAGSKHNTLLVTEQCDQLCVMCSQPPKPQHSDLFDSFAEACSLAPRGATIGISGGEPLLHKERLFEMLERVHQVRPDVRFHVLTNGQHFEKTDQEFLSSSVGQQILWAIPIYSSVPATHDQIVTKDGAFERLIESLICLSRTTAAIELRTVVMSSNQNDLPDLSNFISTNVPFAEFWAIMQMERIGYGRMNWGTEFFDTSTGFENLARAINISTARGMDVRLYNFPLCTIPGEYRSFAMQSISDWKQKYLPLCKDCGLRNTCGGFFEWYLEDDGFENLAAV